MAEKDRKDSEFDVPPERRAELDRTGSSVKDSRPDVEQTPGDLVDEAVKNMPGQPSNLEVDPALGADKPRAGHAAKTPDAREKGQPGGTDTGGTERE
jgi:hypothetical protein